MLTFCEKEGRILKGVKQKLKSFTGIGVFSLPLEDCREDVPAVIEIVAFLIFLKEDIVVGKDFKLIQESINLL